MTPTHTDPLEHVLLNVLGAENASHPLRLAMNAAAVASIDDLMDLTKPDLQSISWVDNDRIQVTLGIAQVNAILSIRSWFQTQTEQDDAVFFDPDQEWSSDHRRALAAATPPDPDAAVTVPAATAPIVAFPASTSAVGTLSAADEFKKGIKGDMHAFKLFKEHKDMESVVLFLCCHGQGPRF